MFLSVIILSGLAKIYSCLFFCKLLLLNVICDIPLYIYFSPNAVGILCHSLPQTEDANHFTREKSEDTGGGKKFE